MNARFFACGTSFTALSGREDYSLRAPRHTFRTPFRRSQLHCSPTHEATSGAVSLAGKGESVKATSPPLCKRSFHWRLNALPHTPEASSPDKFPFRRLSFHCVAGVSNTFRAMPPQRPTHIDNTPTPDPDVRTADALTPFRLSVNLSNYSEQPTAHCTEGSDIVAVPSPTTKSCRSTSYTTPPLCSLLRVLSVPLTLHLHFFAEQSVKAISRHFVITAHRNIKPRNRESGAVENIKIHVADFDRHGSDLTFVRCWLHSV